MSLKEERRNLKALASVPEMGSVANSSGSWEDLPQAFSLEQEWIELTQLRLLLVSLIRIKIMLSAISWNLRETGVGKKWGRSEKPVKWLFMVKESLLARARPPAWLSIVSAGLNPAKDDRGIKEGWCRISDVLALLSLGRRMAVVESVSSGGIIWIYNSGIPYP